MATFAPDGPERCRGLPVNRLGPGDLAQECGPGWRLTHAEGHRHTAPRGVEPRFVYTTFERVRTSSARPVIYGLTASG